MSSKKNNAVNDLLKKKYGSRCMLTERKGRQTYHHIEKVCDGGVTNIDNGGRICDPIHRWINVIEQQDHPLHELVNECLILYKICRDLDKKELLQQYHNEVVPEYNKVLERRK